MHNLQILYRSLSLDNDKRRVGDEPREQRGIHLLGVGLLDRVKQLMDRIGELRMIYCLNGWKLVISYDDPSTLRWAISYNRVPTLVGGWLTTCNPLSYLWLSRPLCTQNNWYLNKTCLPYDQWLETWKDAMQCNEIDCPRSQKAYMGLKAHRDNVKLAKSLRVVECSSLHEIEAIIILMHGPIERKNRDS